MKYGNGARAALLKLLGQRTVLVDSLIASLWLAGFKVVPLEPGDK